MQFRINNWNINILFFSNNQQFLQIWGKYGSEDVNIVGESTNCDLTLNWALFKSVAGQLQIVAKKLETVANRCKLSAVIKIVTDSLKRSQVVGNDRQCSQIVADNHKRSQMFLMLQISKMLQKSQMSRVPKMFEWSKFSKCFKCFKSSICCKCPKFSKVSIVPKVPNVLNVPKGPSVPNSH